MSQDTGRFRTKSVVRVVLFALGFASGFFVRDRQHVDRWRRPWRRVGLRHRPRWNAASAKELIGTSEEETLEP
jgi:hypothetical protein